MKIRVLAALLALTAQAAVAQSLPSPSLGHITLNAPGSTGDISGMSATATGSTTARTQAGRAADVFNVKDFGAVGNGATNDCPAINAAITAANALPAGGEVRFPAATYRVDRSACFSTGQEQCDHARRRAREDRYPDRRH